MRIERLRTYVHNELRDLPRQFWLLVGGTFIYIVGVYMAFPFKTLYMTGELGVSIATAGVIIGVVILAGVPFQFPAGAMVDRLGRKPVMALGVVGSIMFCLFLALSQNGWQAGLALFCDAAFGWPVFLTASQASVADMVPPQRRAEALSILRTVVNVGMAVGPLLAAPLLAGSGTYRWSFAAGSAVCAVFFVTLLVTFRETRPSPTADEHRALETPELAGSPIVPSPEPAEPIIAADSPEDDGHAAGDPSTSGPVATARRRLRTATRRPHRDAATGRVTTNSGYGAVLRDRRFVAFCVVMILPLYCLGQFWETVPVVLRDVQGVTAGQWGLLMTVFAATAAVLQYPLVRGLRRRDPIVVLAAASLLVAGGISALVFVPAGWPIYALITVIAAGYLLLLPIGTAVVTHLAPVETRGRYLGVWTFVFIGGYSLGPLLGGFVITLLGPRWAFAVVALAGATGAALLMALAAALRSRRRAVAGSPGRGSV